MERAGRWLRVSTGGQDEANQAPDIDRHIAQHSYDDGPTYVLHDVSASTGEQDAYLAQVIADGQAGKLQVLVGWHVDRLDRRGPWATGDFVRKCAAAGVRVETTSEGVISDRDLNGLVKQWSAREESEHKSKRVRISHNARRNAGALIGRPPFGMTTQSRADGYRELVPTDLGREVVPQVYRRCIAGESVATIAAWLTRAGVPTMRGGAIWSPKTVHQILRNPAYAGRRRDGNGVTVHLCRPVVDAATFKRAQDSLDGRPHRGPVKSNAALLLGLLSCSQCGGPMYRAKGWGDHYYYRCMADPKFGAARRSQCKNMVPLAYMDQLAIAILRTSDRPVTERTFVKGDNHDAEIEDIAMQLRELPARDLDEDEEDAERARLRAERRRLQELPATPDRWQERETGETYGQMFARLADDRTALREAMRGRVTFNVHRKTLPMVGFTTSVHDAEWVAS